MRFFIRTLIVIALIWTGVLLAGYGILTGSKENAAGLGIQCHYLTARGVSTTQYIHSDSGVIGVSHCPLLRKSETMIDNG